MFLISMKKYSKERGYSLLIVIIKMWGIQKIYYLRCCLLSSSLTAHYAHWHIGSTRCFCIIMIFLQDRVVGPVPNPQPGRPEDHFLSGPYPSTCLAWVALPGVQDASQHSSPGYWITQTTLP